MIIILFVFALFFAVFGIFSINRKKKILGMLFVLLGLMLMMVGLVAITLYPGIWPF